MIAGDYRERKRVNKKGKTVVDKIVISASGTEYAIGPKMGQGGVGSVFRCRRESDKKALAFKEYAPSADPEREKVHRNIRKNLQELIAHPITDRDGSPLKSFIGPIELVDLPASGGFGYVMELVDTDRMVEVKKLWHNYPDAEVLCRIGKNVASLFARLHLGTGWCYKDINEGNIYIDPVTGDVVIVDCDNISVPRTKTVDGTTCYMAPEVYETGCPDTGSDKYSMAVYYYRLLVGGYPMDGKKSLDYMKKHELSFHDAAPVIYGKEALFAFDEDDSSNSISSLTRGKDGAMYRQQLRMWENLPEELKACFRRTFGPALHRPEQRTTDRMWYQCFDRLEKTGLVRCSCGKTAFGSRDRSKKCLFCGATLKKLPKEKPAPANSLSGAVKPAPSGNLPGAAKPARAGSLPGAGKPAAVSAPQEGLTRAVFRVKSDLRADWQFVLRRQEELDGGSLHPELAGEKLMKLQYGKSMDRLAAVNLSSRDWIVTTNGAKTVCRPSERAVLERGTVITVLHRKLQLTVLDYE